MTVCPPCPTPDLDPCACDRALLAAAPLRPEQRQYRTIVIDPPWPYLQRWRQIGSAGLFIRGAAGQYPTLSFERLAGLQVRSWSRTDGAHLYLWTTNAFIEEGLALVREWGFAYKTMLTWVKPQIGMGRYFRNTTEQVLFAVRGRMALQRHDLPTHFVAPRGHRHSEKPDAFYELAEAASPGPRVDVFARKLRDGWTCWGDEVGNEIPGLLPPERTNQLPLLTAGP